MVRIESNNSLEFSGLPSLQEAVSNQLTGPDWEAGLSRLTAKADEPSAERIQRVRAQLWREACY